MHTDQAFYEHVSVLVVNGTVMADTNHTARGQIESRVLVFVYWLTVAKGDGFSSGILAPLEIVRSALQLINS